MAAAALDLTHEIASPPSQPLAGQKAWVGSNISEADWLVRFDQQCLDEIETLVSRMRAQPLPTVVRSIDEFDVPHLRAVTKKAKSILDDGCGFVVLDRLPMDEHPIDEMIACFWLIGQLLGLPVAQKWDGTLIYDVTDTGKKFGYGVRGSTTNVELVFHVDNAFGRSVPDYVGLLCKFPALEGGISRFCSMYTMHDRLLARDPELLARLYEPVLYDRQAEHADGDAKVTSAPFFSIQGNTISSRANVALVRKGYQVSGVQIDSKLEAALSAIEEISLDEDMWYEAPIERGQMQYLNNHEIGHYRSTFKDHDDPTKKRHLYRTWHRNSGKRTYDGI
ncbi:MAG: TauD/TfdA family dioxygenase [Pseudomonadota bacterium]